MEEEKKKEEKENQTKRKKRVWATKVTVTEKGRKLTNRYNSIPSHKKSKQNEPRQKTGIDRRTNSKTNLHMGKRNKDNIQR